MTFSFLFNFPACNNDISDENIFRLWGQKKRVSSGDFKQAPEQPTYLLGYYIPSLREVLHRLGLVTQYPILVRYHTSTVDEITRF